MNSIIQAFYNWYREKIKHPKYRWFVIIGTVLYLVSPIDIAPDFIPIIGWIDDGLLISLLVAELSSLILENRPKKNTQGNSEGNIQQKDILSQGNTIDVEPIR
ncbi:YkvA family protein [Crocosphaera sp. UHCC 0190]|uniref:YkvA family protein n=1 Tax=Crocosphaera sp. UHCC 0190 TaxID=3110246 RepID=UPI002B206854|nr:YkvA family protein [Crocosphaera sp. UHCC 0190]MEA5509474.1 YkvA family protein [Crocosphaera sp. UHCC 0190]